MPELNDHRSALGVHGSGDLFPSLDLLVGVAARRPSIALRLRGDLRRLGDDQASGSALRVIFNSEWTRHQTRTSAVPGQRRHDDMIGKLQSTGGSGFEESLW
jgi:hypothetical protein